MGFMYYLIVNSIHPYCDLIVCLCDFKYALTLVERKFMKISIRNDYH